MSKIRILSDNLANQIAAGEVVERPASVIKELLENSIDAGATRIEVNIELGGRRLMRISDDGEGMSRDDSVLAFERHATSKINKLEDLSSIQTLGFRGEALASIASVARVELVTKTLEAKIATRVNIDGGKIIDVKDAARNTGTTISVRDLFFNTPARRKFMRSEATENFHLTNIITHYALAHHEIAFTLTNNGRENLRVSQAKDLKERAYQIFGRDLIESFLPVTGGREYIANISGFVSAPRERRSTRDSQYFFINGRFVRDKLISKGLQEGFRAVLPHGVYPVALLFLEIPLEEVDVNVHPAKTEVRFRRAEAVKEVIADAVRNSLRNNGLLSQSSFVISPLPIEQTPQLQKVEQQRIEFAIETPHFEATLPKSFEEQVFEINLDSNEFENAAENRQESIISERINNEFQIENQKSQIANYKLLPPVDSALKATKVIEVKDLSPTKIRPIGQLHDSYIIAVDDEGLLLIDQHVAHERILFDKFRQKEGERLVETQSLLLPETLDLSPAQAVAFQTVEPELEKLGFSLMKLSGRTIAIKGVPADLAGNDARNLLSEILETIDREKRGNAIETIRDEIAASMACKAAVKINMKLTTEKMQWMIDKLVLTANAITCPHGRPIVLRLTMKDIERSFHRT
jgi:DNA mismatch repair protein MutL